ncbi:MAG: hypothetical protein V1848_01640 [Candidatus Magasanikbacteria bacterium]
MNNKQKIALSVLGIGLTLGAGGTAFAANTENAKKLRENFADKKAQMEEVFETDDFATWKSHIEERVSEQKRMAEEMLQNATEENFAKMKQVHTLMKDGKVDEANALREELGLPEMGGKGMHKGMGGCMKNRPDVTNTEE